jgi:hypothetical protein
LRKATDSGDPEAKTTLAMLHQRHIGRNRPLRPARRPGPGVGVGYLLRAAAFQVEAARERMDGGHVPVTDYVFPQLDARHRLRCVRRDGGDLDVRPPGQAAGEVLELRGKIVMNEESLLDR